MEKNKNMKNMIITLSGQPVAGKGTTVKVLVEKLENNGYKKENIHVIETGHEFRKYFNKIIELTHNLNNVGEKRELSDSKELKSIFQDYERRQALIQSLINLKKNKIDVSKISSIEQANNIEEFKPIRKVVDTVIDENIKQKGIEINKEEYPDDIWIVDSRLAFHNIPDSFSVRLTTNANVAGERLFNDKNRGKEDEYKTIEEATQAREERRIGEQKRYKERYGIDLEDENNYDLIIDTSYSNIEDVSDTILTCLDRYIKNKDFAKKWTSPKTLLPLQGERDTFGTAKYSFEELLESIEKHGYIPSQAIEVVEVDGKKYIIEGHHRNFCSAYLGNTLVPYEVLAKDDEEIPYYRNTARERAKSLNLRNLYGHEAIIAENDPTFSYEDIYPGIYEELTQKVENDMEL